VRAPPLIIGAGPVGLAAALFLVRRGIVPRVVEMREEPSRESRALAVNPRTLELLAPSGVTGRMLEMGLQIGGARFNRIDGKGRSRLVTVLEFAGLHPEYPFMLALSQAATERLLEQAMVEAGGSVERGRKLVECRLVDEGGESAGVEAVIEHGGSREAVRAPWLLAADGAHSTVRGELDMAFRGSSFPDDWYLADAPLRTELPEDRAHAFFLADGMFVFLIRVIDPGVEPEGASLWRVISNRPAPLERLADIDPAAAVRQAGPAVWESSFTVSHRMIESMARRPVYFAGDAAHIHSPIGARGMNLGIEDAWVFAACAAAGRLADYDRLRRGVDRRVVRRVHLLSRVAAAQPRSLRPVRRFGLPAVLAVAPLRRRMIRTATGLDHDLPRIESGQAVG
jgi:2-polyprenyl-6-methoxyphenol hydroxylase-like FAD-dependent oxidoreductase